LPILPPGAWRNSYQAIFLSYVKNCVEDMATFTALAKISSTKFSCNNEGSWAWQNFYPVKNAVVKGLV
jgi:hypothetical protein